MKIVLVALLSIFTVETGFAAHYAEGRMEKVVRTRQAGLTAADLPTPIGGVIGFVARPDCGEIGRRVWICHESEGCKGPYLVADCANSADGDAERMRRRGIVAEVGWNTARRWGTVNKSPQDVYVAVISWQANQSALHQKNYCRVQKARPDRRRRKLP